MLFEIIFFQKIEIFLYNFWGVNSRFSTLKREVPIKRCDECTKSDQMRDRLQRTGWDLLRLLFEAETSELC